MRNMGKVIVTDKESGRMRVRCYDIRAVSQQYSNISGLLAGFAFTVIILITQESSSSLNTVEILKRNLSAICFFIVFFGSILSSFVFAVISGEEELTPRVNKMIFFAGASFSLVIGLIFWSISSILREFLAEEVGDFVGNILPFFLSIHPLYVMSSIFDNIYIFKSVFEKSLRYSQEAFLRPPDYEINQSILRH